MTAAAAAGAPLVSVVIPAYNMAGLVAEAIDSVLAQDYPRVELIVIDDGSSDGSADVLARYAGRCRIESQPNAGQVRTLTRGWALATGDILGFLSADDVLRPGAVSRAVATLAARPEAVLTYCDFVTIDGRSREVRRIRTPEFDYAEMVCRFVCPPGPGAFFRRAAYEATGTWDDSLRVMLDYDYWVRLGLLGPFVRIPEVLAGYRVHEGSQTFAGYDEKASAEPVLILTRLFGSGRLPPALQARRAEAMGYAHLVSAQLNFRAGRVRAGLGQLRHAWESWPRALASRKALRIALNIALNRLWHRLLWRTRSVREMLWHERG